MEELQLSFWASEQVGRSVLLGGVLGFTVGEGGGDGGWGSWRAGMVWVEVMVELGAVAGIGLE